MKIYKLVFESYDGNEILSEDFYHNKENAIKDARHLMARAMGLKSSDSEIIEDKYDITFFDKVNNEKILDVYIDIIDTVDK